MLIRGFDIILSIILIILTLPLIIFLLFTISIFISYPPIYISVRLGLHGCTYKYIKLKTMIPGRKIGRIFFEQNRLNFYGNALRKFHLDELPELYLIFFGKMSFVGPRPLPEKLLTGLNSIDRESVLPGWTGLAQLSLAKNGKLNKRHQIKLDRYYIEHRNIIYNLKILVRTLILTLKNREIDLSVNSTDDRKKFKINLEN